ncbi:MAG: hypothetical protein IJ151_01745 [Bacteroidales bacterium]|nr:hypothetical protein [Bacteroidales bacterium]
MKKLSAILFFTLFVPMLAFAQLQIRTHKEKISDFVQKTTMVVLTGNDSLDIPIRHALKDFWSISAYEFCSSEDFIARSGSSDCYFLAVADGGDGLRYWHLVKGGQGKKSLSSMLTVATVPVCPADGFTGREDFLLPVLLCNLQNVAAKAVGSNYHGPGKPYSSPKQAASIPLMISEDELSPVVGAKEIEDCEAKRIEFVSAADADKAFVDGTEAAVCYVVGPRNPRKGQVFYVFLADADTYGLYYNKKHKVGSAGCGLLKEDLKAFAKGR